MKMSDLVNSAHSQNIVLKYGWSLIGLIVLAIVLTGAISSNRSTRELNKFQECGTSGIPCVVVQGDAAGTPVPMEVKPVGTTTHAAVSVLTSSTSALSASTPRRLLVILVNDGANTIYCNLAGAAAVLNQGVRLNSAGGNLLLDQSVMATEIFCIAETATTVLLVTEGT